MSNNLLKNDNDDDNNTHDNVIIINNEKIINFYNNNKHLDIIKINLLYIDLFENLLNNNKDINIENEICSSLNKQNNNIQNILSSMMFFTENNKLELVSIKSEIDNFKSVLSNVNSTLINKIYETKEIYLSETKDIIKMSELENSSKINILLEKHDSILSDKILLTINEVIPKSQATYYNEMVNELKKDINISLEQYHKTNPEKVLDIIINKYDNIVNNIIQSESRMNNNITQLNETGIKNIIMQTNTNDELLKYINKYNNSSIKGNLGENKLEEILIEQFPSSEIINTSNFTGKCDFSIKRKNKDDVLIETKDYNYNVKISETEKFIRDCTNNNTHGIFLSQNSGIVNKDNYQIDFHNGKILIYIHNVNYEKYKISIGMKIIDLLSQKLISLNESNINITPEIFKNINDEYQIFMTIKSRMIIDLKDFYKKSMDNFIKMSLPELERILSKYYSNNKKNMYVCEICKTYESESLKSLARHKPSCLKKQDTINNSSDV